MNKTNQILIVEDEKDISDLLEGRLKANGYRCKVISRGDDALNYIQTIENENNIPSLFILDRMLPGNNGIEICKFLRLYKKTRYNPILMVTALTRPDDIVDGLDAGADDYIPKPFDINVLIARVRALLRRYEILNETTSTNLDSILQINGIKIDKNQCKAWTGKKELELTLSEYKILCAFMENPGKVLTRNQLVEYIQDGPVHVTDRTIDTHIFGLRKKLGKYSNMIETIRGIGYRVVGHVL
ncbi:MAG: response regulator transcription factor [Bacteriovoracaceae bacterium]|nr:response regulator transcription factor [Bacteriovoracaceae bacterium]